MSCVAITTIVTILESLPENVPARVVEHLREYLMDLRDETEWDSQFERTQPALASAARRARKQSAEVVARNPFSSLAPFQVY
jgi:hypothetical protein